MLKEKIDNKTLGKILLLMFGIILITLISIVIKDTHAFYDYESGWTPIFNSRAGNFAGEGESIKDGPLTNRDTDVNIIFYTQMPDNPNKYMISKYIPVNGYEVNEEASNCYPATGGDATYSDYSISNDGTLSLTYTENSKPTQVVCRIYYDRDKLSDVIIYAYVEDSTGDRKYNDKTYKLNNQVPTGYKMTNYECKSKTSETSFTYDATNGFNVVTNGPDTCYAYFSKS